MRARNTREYAYARKLLIPYSICSAYSLNLLHLLSHDAANIALNDTPQCLLNDRLGFKFHWRRYS